VCDTDLTYVLDRKWPLTYHTLRSLAIRDPSQCDRSLFFFADKNVPLSLLHTLCTGSVVRSFSVFRLFQFGHGSYFVCGCFGAGDLDPRGYVKWFRYLANWYRKRIICTRRKIQPLSPSPLVLIHRSPHNTDPSSHPQPSHQIHAPPEIDPRPICRHVLATGDTQHLHASGVRQPM